MHAWSAHRHLRVICPTFATSLNEIFLDRFFTSACVELARSSENIVRRRVTEWHDARSRVAQTARTPQQYDSRGDRPPGSTHSSILSTAQPRFGILLPSGRAGADHLLFLRTGHDHDEHVEHHGILRPSVSGRITLLSSAWTPAIGTAPQASTPDSTTPTPQPRTPPSALRRAHLRTQHVVGIAPAWAMRPLHLNPPRP